MTVRLRHCAECPLCLTRYLLGASPYTNGAYILTNARFESDEYTLYCSCAKPAVLTLYRIRDLRLYKVSGTAHRRGYGAPDEIVLCALMASRPSKELAPIVNSFRKDRLT